MQKYNILIHWYELLVSQQTQPIVVPLVFSMRNVCMCIDPVKAFQNVREITAGKYRVISNHFENQLRTKYDIMQSDFKHAFVGKSETVA